jgi:hypothetical protein
MQVPLPSVHLFWEELVTIFYQRLFIYYIRTLGCEACTRSNEYRYYEVWLYKTSRPSRQ